MKPDAPVMKTRIGRMSYRIPMVRKAMNQGMRRLIVTTLLLVLALAATALAVVKNGDGNPNTLTGTNGADRLYGFGSADKLTGKGGGDLLDGDTGIDTL